jgi:multidrug efflux pump subunit AcrA (membrane-fusion protein)
VSCPFKQNFLEEEKMRKTLWIVSILVIASLALAACGGAAPAPTGGDSAPVVETVIVEVTSSAPVVVAPTGFGVTLETVKARGNLVCGVN